MSLQLGMVWHAQSSLKYEITNISGKGWVILLIFCMELFASCWISIEATNICYFGLPLSGVGYQPTRLSDVLNLKNLKTMWGIKLIFCFHWSYKKYHAILGYTAKYSWPIIWLVNHNTWGPFLHLICYFGVTSLL